jgi:hypothetical protein
LVIFNFKFEFSKSKFHENGGKWPEKIDAQSILEENIHINAIGSVEWAKNAKFVIEEEKRGVKRMRDDFELKPRGQSSIHPRYISIIFLKEHLDP